MMKPDFWGTLFQLAATLSSDDEPRTHGELLDHFAHEFAVATPDQQRDMRLALWAVLTFLEQLSRATSNHH